MNKHTNKQTDKKVYKQIDKQADKQIDKHMDKQTFSSGLSMAARKSLPFISSVMDPKFFWVETWKRNRFERIQTKLRRYNEKIERITSNLGKLATYKGFW